ncbi:MAG: sigma-70 family RNA polymerase sigma factor [Planctomycetota bacterium]
MNEADEHLLSLIRQGDQDGWRQFVSRFQGRLVAFAERQVGQSSSAEDLVQETFVGFLSSLASYQSECELESFLFQILRRRIVDHYRRQGKSREVPVCQFSTPTESNAVLETADSSENATERLHSVEQQNAVFKTLVVALRSLAERLQSGALFRDLKIAEGLFYAGRKNKELAQAIGISENEIAVVKRRLIRRLADDVQQTMPDVSDVELVSHLLTEAWESQRPSCPKRSTLGKFSLGILPSEWEDYVDFHVRVLGCTFCNANLSELELQATATSASDERQDRLFQSTIGFFRAD